MKTATIKKGVYSILETMTSHDIINAYYGSCNLTAEYLNDYSSEAINLFIASFIDDNRNDYDLTGELEIRDILENPDSILNNCANEFYSALAYIIGDSERAEWLIKNASYHLEPWGTFYIFANADIACSYIIRADNESEAINELITRFEQAFIIDEEDITEDTLYNDNGEPVNIDYLVLLGVITSC